MPPDAMGHLPPRARVKKLTVASLDGKTTNHVITHTHRELENSRAAEKIRHKKVYIHSIGKAEQSHISCGTSSRCSVSSFFSIRRDRSVQPEKRESRHKRYDETRRSVPSQSNS